MKSGSSAPTHTGGHSGDAAAMSSASRLWLSPTLRTGTCPAPLTIPPANLERRSPQYPRRCPTSRFHGVTSFTQATSVSHVVAVARPRAAPPAPPRPCGGLRESSLQARLAPPGPVVSPWLTPRLRRPCVARDSGCCGMRLPARITRASHALRLVAPPRPAAHAPRDAHARQSGTQRPRAAASPRLRPPPPSRGATRVSRRACSEQPQDYRHVAAQSPLLQWPLAGTWRASVLEHVNPGRVSTRGRLVGWLEHANPGRASTNQPTSLPPAASPPAIAFRRASPRRCMPRPPIVARA